jgi:hypothetical protein
MADWTIRGDPLDQLIRGPMELGPFRLAVGAAVLRELHTKHLIHKDIKPANLLRMSEQVTFASWVWDRIATAARGRRRCHRRHRPQSGLHGSGTDRTHEPLG